MSKAELSFNGLIGVMEAILESVKRFQEFEERYQANQASFERIQQQFQQIEEGSSQLQSLTEERLTELSALNIELKVRHSQTEQVLGEVKTLLEEVRAQQARWEQELAAAETRRRADGDQSCQTAQALEVVGALVEQLQGRQSHLEQSLVAVQTLIEDHGKRSNAQDQVWHSVRSLSEQIADRQGQVEKALSVVQATQEAEKGLIAHFEKVLGAVRARMADLETRQAQAELNVAALKPAGGDTPAINETALAAVQELMREVKERQSESEKEWAALSSLHQQLQDGQARTEQMLGATMTLVEEVQKAAARASEQVTRVEENSAQAIEAARSAQALAAQALEKANEIPGPSEIPPGAELSGEQQQELTEGFQQFLKRCETEHKSLLEQEGRIQTQLRIALESFPARTEAAVNKFLEQSRTRVEQSCLSWLQHRERRIVDLENHFDGIVGKALQTQKVLEEQIAKSAAAHSVEEPPEMSELMQVLESTSAAHSSELRFVKTLLWVTLAGVGLAYALVVYAVILRS